MKKITNIELQNFRAFYGKYEKIDLSNGENLLIYGENGSGKSSLFKALNSYFSKSRIIDTAFVSHHHTGRASAKVKLEFCDFNQTSKVKIDKSEKSYVFGKNKTNNSVGFIQDADLIKGFLEYKNLLDIYLHKEIRPNLFELIVERLLENHIPVATGATYRLGVKWKQIKYDLIKGASSRRNEKHLSALRELPKFQHHLDGALTNIFAELNTMLEKYFPELSIELSYTLKRISFRYSKNKNNWKIDADLRLNIKKDGIVIMGDYSDLLNEARLSAFSICLYLASLKQNPNLDLQVLYLDDIFIGLDTGNRMPILEIVHSEFKDYQIFISTYDKGWFDIARRFFDAHDENRWKSLELYVGKDKISKISFDKPTIVVGISDYERAVRYLHDRLNPDYPASANYFRKAIEETISTKVPAYELADSNLALLPDYKLSQRLEKTRRFMQRTGHDLSHINQIISLLHGLLHPLSHFSKVSSVYKLELLRIEREIVNFQAQLSRINFIEKYKCILEKSKPIKLMFEVNKATKDYYCYEIILRDSLVVKRKPDLSLEICESECHVTQMYGKIGAKTFSPVTVSKGKFVYKSVEIAYIEIYTFCNGQTPFIFPAGGYVGSCEWLDATGWQPLSKLVVW